MHIITYPEETIIPYDFEYLPDTEIFLFKNQTFLVPKELVWAYNRMPMSDGDEKLCKALLFLPLRKRGPLLYCFKEHCGNNRVYVKYIKKYLKKKEKLRQENINRIARNKEIFYEKEKQTNKMIGNP